MNQREKDIEAALNIVSRDSSPTWAWVNGAEYARKELFERLRASNTWSSELDALAKEYGL